MSRTHEVSCISFVVQSLILAEDKYVIKQMLRSIEPNRFNYIVDYVTEEIVFEKSIEKRIKRLESIGNRLARESDKNGWVIAECIEWSIKNYKTSKRKH